MPLSLKKIAYIILAKVLKWGASYANSRRIRRISARLARLFSNAPSFARSELSAGQCLRFDGLALPFYMTARREIIPNRGK
jgi:hypothetical protein